MSGESHSRRTVSNSLQLVLRYIYGALRLSSALFSTWPSEPFVLLEFSRLQQLTFFACVG